MTKHDKLVRDLIPQIISSSGRTAHTRTLDDAAYLAALKYALSLAPATTDCIVIAAITTVRPIPRIHINKFFTLLATAPTAPQSTLDAIAKEKRAKDSGKSSSLQT